MTTLFEEFLNGIKTSSEIEKIKILCDKIQKEEEEKYEDKEFFNKNKPKGPNVFLALMLKDKKRFLSLEREFKDTFIAKVTSGGRLVEKCYNIDEVKTQKILEKFAQIYKHENGE